MNKILVGALVCAAVAAVVYYLNDPEKVHDQLGDLKDKASDLKDKASDAFDRTKNAFNRQTGQV